MPLIKSFVYIVSALSSTVTLDHFWNCMLNSIRNVKFSGGSISSGGAPLFLDQTETQRTEKNFLGDSPLPYLRVWITGLPPYLKVWSGTEVYKNAKARNVYHRSLFYFWSNYDGLRTKVSMRLTLSPVFFWGEGGVCTYTGYSAQQWLQEGSVIWTGGIGSWRPQRENRQYNII